ncbi:DUF421 domain-containing protein [Sporolactobacillus sp. CPB3-1]|uniref:DUF421 domain-containing protein n=1 Tax=Sporolactobacillus mangiferae TaxID=2940498 RepID=A0ABT0M6J3_9BACL|nr:DUF421 domain-containing protein [Sporolactobacillus mangiferae]MCL1630491.1 DUF421 domain-containing protein [Sporolactobacillus mangiferae]
METSVVRTICLVLLVMLGFRKVMRAKLSEQTGADLVLLLSSSALATAAVLMPEKPLLPILVPLMLLILIDRSRLWIDHFISHGSSYEPLPHYVKQAKKKETEKEVYMPRSGLALIEKGKVRNDNLARIGKTQFWLRRELRKFGYRNIRQVNYLTIDALGNFYMDLNQFMH